MKRLALIILLALLPLSAWAQGAVTMYCGPGVRKAVPCGFPAPLGYQQITSLSVATGLTVPIGATWAVIIPDAAGTNVRWRDDGTAPTATIGMELSSGSSLTYGGQPLSAIQFIQESATATLSISYYK